VSFANWHDFLYMGGHYPFVWSAYGIGAVGIAITLARPLRARRRFFAEQAQRLRRQPVGAENTDASRSS
jgi:heme exporter protein D